MLNRVVGATQRLLARSRLAVTCGIKLKRQCDAVLGLRLSSGISAQVNGEEWLARLVAPHSKTFIDVGANVGSWAIMFASAMSNEPLGLLFEPAPDTVIELNRRVADAKLSNLRIIPRAVGSKAGRGSFYAEENCGETSSLLPEHSSQGAGRIWVDITTIDIEARKHDLVQVDFLKVDAEGYDLHVLKGAEDLIISRRISVIQFEYNYPWARAGSTLLEAYRFLEDNGYVVRLLKNNQMYIIDPEVTGEYYRYSNFVAYCKSNISDILDKQCVGSIL